MSRVVITGLNMTSSLGIDLASNWNMICAGLSGLSPTQLPYTKLIGQIKENISSDFAENVMNVIFI